MLVIVGYLNETMKLLGSHEAQDLEGLFFFFYFWSWSHIKDILMVMGCYYVEDIYPKLAIDVGLMLIPGEMVMMMVLRVVEDTDFCQDFSYILV